jgi:uncharacterized protein (DUF1810 family)
LRRNGEEADLYLTDQAEFDPLDLQRFVAAQHGVFDQALAEVRRGAKRSHWMWFIFPQIAGLGMSEIAQLYGIRSLDEARAYLNHPLLGARYREIVGALQDLEQADPVRVFGPVDAQKLRSLLTLFALVGDDASIAAALERWFGAPDRATLAILG